MRWIRFVDDDFWKMLSKFLIVIVLVIVTISLVERISMGDNATTRLDCVRGEC